MTIFGKYTKEDFKYPLQKDPNVYWTFRYPTSDDEITIERLYRSNPTRLEVMTAELALTFAESNIAVLGEEEHFIKATEDYFTRLQKIRQLPRELVIELAFALNDFNEEWGAVKE